MVRLNVDVNNKPICNDDALGGNTAWFMGKISFTGATHCAVSGCEGPVNPDKCRWFSGAWSNQCYVSSLLP
jgi:hypothetical protein